MTRQISTLLAAVLLAAGGPVCAGEGGTTAHWRAQGQAALEAALAVQPNTRRAKNVILFVGDGNGIASVTATRIFDGQSRGEPGEDNVLSYERFPHVALSKTYNTNQQTADSAGTMSAIMTGVKTRAGVISLGPEITTGDCAGVADATLPTLLEQAEQRGLATGVVTTTRITHATPAATYAHSPHRDWEDDGKLPEAARALGCVDIAAQLVDRAGRGPDVVFGGGRRHFLPAGRPDPEHPELEGRRGDGRDLVAEWQARHPGGAFVWNREQLQAARGSSPVLGLFGYDQAE